MIPKDWSHKFGDRWLLCLPLLFVFGCARQPFVMVSPEPHTDAWWLRAGFHPFGRSIRGIPISQIDPKWCAANEFTNDLLPNDKAGDDRWWRQSIEEYHLGYNLQGHFDRTDGMQLAVLGVYERCDHLQGTFLLVADVQNSKVGPIRFLEQFKGAARFGVLVPSEDNSFSISWCTNCDNIGPPLKWSQSDHQFEWQDEKDDN